LIKKDLTIPIRVLQDYALLERLPKHHPKRAIVETDYARQLAGYRGEKNLRYFLSFLPDYEYQIFFDLRLNIQNVDFQIDCFILSPRFSLIIESKNIAGTLIFDSRSEQCIRTYNGKEEGFPNPILQVARHRLLLQRWLKQYKFPSLPIEHFVAIAFPTTIIQSAYDDHSIYDKVIQAEGVINKIEKIKLRYKTEYLSTRQINSLCKTLLDNHSPPETHILKKFELHEEDLIKGVLCPKCPTTIMNRKHGTWFCPRCKLHSKTAHEQALLEYFLLYDSNITNKQFRDFTLLSNRCAAAYLLSTSTLRKSQGGNNVFYHPPSFNWFLHNPQIKKLL